MSRNLYRQGLSAERFPALEIKYAAVTRDGLQQEPPHGAWER